MRTVPVNIGRVPTAVLVLLALTVTGCDGDSQADRQWAQESIARQEERNRQTAETARNLVEADAQARKELVVLQQEMQTERREIGKQRDSLENDRREIAAQRHRDPIIAGAIEAAGLLILCALPLVLCWYLLRGQVDDDAGALEEILLLEISDELASPGSSLLLPTPHDTDRTALSLPSADEEETDL